VRAASGRQRTCQFSVDAEYNPLTQLCQSDDSTNFRGSCRSDPPIHRKDMMGGTATSPD